MPFGTLLAFLGAMNLSTFPFPLTGVLFSLLSTAAAVACSETDPVDPPSGMAGGGSTGAPQPNGSGGCTPELYDVEEFCYSPHFSGGFVSSVLPDDPLHNPEYDCTSDYPDISFADGRTALYRYRQGCGLAEWDLLGPSPPDHSLVWKLGTEGLLGCSYREDVVIAGQCGESTAYAGIRFECENFDEHYCVWKDQNMGGAGGTGGTSECYSPDEPSEAYTEGAVGCTCSGFEGRAVCVGHAALFCESGTWISGEDGPCWRADACDEEVMTWQQCLAEYESCAETETDEYCGRNPI